MYFQTYLAYTEGLLQKEHPWIHLLEAQSGEPKLFIAFSLQLCILNLMLDLSFPGLDIHEQDALNPAMAPGPF